MLPVLRDARGAPRKGDDLLSGGRGVLLVFFKTTCPTCRLAWPYLARLSGVCSTALRVVAVSQDDPTLTESFLAELGGPESVEVLYDPEPRFDASNAMGVESVPHHVFLRGGGNPDALARRTWFGWSRHELEDLARELSRDHGPFPLPLIPAEDPVPALRPG